MHGATYAIKNQRKARKPLVGGFGCLELVLYGIRELAKHHYELLGNDLDIEWTTLVMIQPWRVMTVLQFQCKQPAGHQSEVMETNVAKIHFLS